jgi:hypothetical protein
MRGGGGFLSSLGEKGAGRGVLKDGAVVIVAQKAFIQVLMPPIGFPMAFSGNLKPGKAGQLP